MTTDNVLDFDFSNVSDVELPPTGGVRELRFDTAPEYKEVDQGGGLKKLIIAKPKINDGGKGVYPEDEQDRVVYLQFDMDDSRQKTQAKRMFLAAGVDATNFSQASQMIVHKVARGNFKQTNGKRRDGTPAVFFNLVDWIVDASMIKNIPGRTPPVPTVS